MLLSMVFSLSLNFIVYFLASIQNLWFGMNWRNIFCFNKTLTFLKQLQNIGCV